MTNDATLARKMAAAHAKTAGSATTRANEYAGMGFKLAEAGERKRASKEGLRAHALYHFADHLDQQARRAHELNAPDTTPTETKP